MISVLISVYKKESPEYFDMALQSIYNQTFKDFEVILVVDGPLTNELNLIISKWERIFERMIIIRLESNIGLANALNEGIKRCNYELIARMDTDDYSEPHRLQVQYEFMNENPHIDVLGSDIVEFEKSLDNLLTVRAVPENHEAIVKSLCYRSPMNHVSVMYRKSSVLSAGGYNPLFGDDDYLWARMYVNGCKFHNIKMCLVKVRVSVEGYKRRGGLNLLIWDFKVRKYLFENNKIGVIKLIIIMLAFSIVRFMPTYLRKIFYENIARKRVSKMEYIRGKMN